MKRTPAIAFLVVVIGLGAAVWIFLRTAAYGFSTRQPPTALESFLARSARRWAVPGDARAQNNPAPATPEVLAEARAHWADHCATCHANNGSGDTEMGRNLYPRAPDMRAAATQDLSDGELFFIIQNGVRLTGMPGWGSGTAHDAQDSWKLVRFIRHLPELSPTEAAEMEKMNPKTPAELDEERAEEEFLNGDDSHANSHATEHHHH
jgi:mono/diheme cytochrome c family protein